MAPQSRHDALSQLVLCGGLPHFPSTIVILLTLPPALYHSLVHLPGSAHPVPEVFPEEIHRSPYPEHLLIFTETLLCAKDPRGAEMNEAMVSALGK